MGQKTPCNGGGQAVVILRKDAEGAEDFPPGSDPGRGRAARRDGFENYRTAPLFLLVRERIFSNSVCLLVSISGSAKIGARTFLK